MFWTRFNPDLSAGYQQESCASGPLADTTRKVLSKGVFGQRQGIVGKAVETGEPIIFEDVQNDPRYAELSHSKGSRSVIDFSRPSQSRQGEVFGRDCL